MNENPSPTRGGVHLFETGQGARIYQIPMQEFSILWGYAYLVLLEDVGFGTYRVLIDTGSGFGESNQHLEQGFREVSKRTGTEIGLGDLTHIFITHGHIDHFGGLSYVRPLTPAKIGVHELDLQTLSNYGERLAVVSRRLEEFLAEAGVPADRRSGLIEMYQFPKKNYRSVQIDFTFEAAGMRVGPFEFFHVPGHCAGHVAIRLHDVLFAGDHVLDGLSPHQSPESLTLFTGLGHYLRSLDDLEKWAGDVRLTLGGHRNPITDLRARCATLRQVHQLRLEQILELMGQPRTIVEVSRALFGETSGYNVLLALEETGAHIEYLAQRGRLRISNLTEMEASREPVAILYQRLDSTRENEPLEM